MAKYGAGTLAAMWRLGLKELRNAINPSKESVADSEIGMYGTATPGQVDTALGVGGRGQESLQDLRSAAREKAQENEKGTDGPQQDRGMER